MSHRCSIFCILPPHILLNIARKGTEAQRDFALNALSSDHTFRSSRLAYSLLGGMKITQEAISDILPPRVHRAIYDARNSQDLPGMLIRGEGQPVSSDASINQAYDGLEATYDFYMKAYHRNSIDNAGLPLRATVHFDDRYDNAFWNGQQMVFGDGDGVIFTGFTTALDVIGHELTHGVTGSEANLNYQGQSGALNESISDVFGSLVKQYKLAQTADKADWLIGGGILAAGIQGTGLRSMKAPGTAYDDPTLGKDPQPADMSQYVSTTDDNGGVHTNSGIPNRAFYLAAANIGGKAWEKAGQIWYDTVTDRSLKPSANFLQFANLTVINATHRYGGGSTERKAVLDAWNQVGVQVKLQLTGVGATV